MSNLANELVKRQLQFQSGVKDVGRSVHVRIARNASQPKVKPLLSGPRMPSLVPKAPRGYK